MEFNSIYGNINDVSLSVYDKLILKYVNKVKKVKGVVSIENQEEFTTILRSLKNDDLYRKSTGEINKNYIQDNVGATQSILKWMQQKI